MKQPKLIGMIKPDTLRSEIKFAAERVKIYSVTPGKDLKTWGNILEKLVKRIPVPGE